MRHYVDYKKLKSSKYNNLISFAYWEFDSSNKCDGLLCDTAVDTLQSIDNQQKIQELGLHVDTVCMGLNYGTFKENIKVLPDFANFHTVAKSTSSTTEYFSFRTNQKEHKSLSNDERLANSLYGTEAWGSLMLDLICIDKKGEYNGYPESKIQVVEKELKTPEVKLTQINGVLKILKYFEVNSPNIICFGENVYKVLSEHLDYIKNEIGLDTKLLSVKHYSHTTHISHNDYIRDIHQRLVDYYS